MKLTRKIAVDHFGKAGLRGIEHLKIHKDGSFMVATPDKSLLLVAPPLDVKYEGNQFTYKAPEDARVYGVTQFLKILRSLQSSDGSIDIGMDKKGMVMTLETSRLAYNYVLSADESFVLNEEGTQKMLDQMTFTAKYILTNTHMRNILQVIGILSSEGVTFRKDDKGMMIDIGSKSMHSASVKIAGDPLHVDAIEFMTCHIQDILKLLATQIEVTLEINDEGQIARFTTLDGYQYYVQSVETA